MSTKLKHFLSINDLSDKDIGDVLYLSKTIKSRPSKYKDALSGRVLGLLFHKPSTRTRVSFEAGMYQLGGNVVFLAEKDIQIGRGETIRDTAQVLSGYINGLVIRTYSHNILEEFKKYSSIPVINGLSDLLHPCQILADIFTIKEMKNKIGGLNLAYIGDGANNMAHSWILAADRMGIHLKIATPPIYPPNPDILAGAGRGFVRVTDNPEEAVENADVIYTDVWVSMGQDSERQERLNSFKQYQINGSLLHRAKSDAIVMHCLPAHAGEEITEDVLYGKQSVVFRQAENRLHTQKALLVKLIG